MMPETRDNVIDELISILADVIGDCYSHHLTVSYPEAKSRAIQRGRRRILEIPELAVIDRGAELPLGKWTFQIPAEQTDWLNQRTGYQEAQQDILKAGWVKEVRPNEQNGAK